MFARVWKVEAAAAPLYVKFVALGVPTKKMLLFEEVK
jgi:hypothetical protein